LILPGVCSLFFLASFAIVEPRNLLNFSDPIQGRLVALARLLQRRCRRHPALRAAAVGRETEEQNIARNPLLTILMAVEASSCSLPDSVQLRHDHGRICSEIRHWSRCGCSAS
jgi:hypothetical protein